MKFSDRAKLFLYATLITLYVSGVAVYVFERWFLAQSDLGVSPQRFNLWFLRTHSIVGLAFLIVFGYLLHSHVRPGWRARRKRKSGLAFMIPLGVLILTVPSLFYLGDEDLKNKVVWIHTYVGLAIVLPFFIHLLTRVPRTIVRRGGGRHSYWQRPLDGRISEKINAKTKKRV